MKDEAIDIETRTTKSRKYLLSPAEAAKMLNVSKRFLLRNKHRIRPVYLSPRKPMYPANLVLLIAKEGIPKS